MSEYERTIPSNGKLFMASGSSMIDKFIELIGDSEAPVVLIPTGVEGSFFNPNSKRVNFFREKGMKNITILHTRDKEVANSEEFVRPLREAKAVYFDGGRASRLTDAYLHTLVHRELCTLLDRDGIIGGERAGANILASSLARDGTHTNEIITGDQKEGFGFLKDAVIDQLLLKRNRQFDLLDIIEAHPNLIGIGIDEDSAIIVSGDFIEAIGNSYVAVYDYQQLIPPNGKFYFLAPGDRINLSTRKAFQYQVKPLERVIAASWSDIKENLQD